MTTLSLLTEPTVPWRALAGPAAAGACLGLGADLGATAYWALALPSLFVVLAVLMLPTLYIASTLLGESSDLGRLATSALAALDDGGSVLLGVSPALGFLVVTTQNTLTPLLGVGALAMTSLLMLRSLFLRQFTAQRALLEVPGRVLATYTMWSLVTLGIGADWFLGHALSMMGVAP